MLPTLSRGSHTSCAPHLAPGPGPTATRSSMKPFTSVWSNHERLRGASASRRSVWLAKNDRGTKDSRARRRWLGGLGARFTFYGCISAWRMYVHELYELQSGLPPKFGTRSSVCFSKNLIKLVKGRKGTVVTSTRTRGRFRSAKINQGPVKCTYSADSILTICCRANDQLLTHY